jgi:short-subunit dehydrogenase
MPMDLTLPNAPQALFEDVQKSGAPVDVLVNNAGYGVMGEFAQTPLLEDVGMMQLNMVALTVLTKLFLGPMLQRKSGKVLNVASTAGFQPGPKMAVYYASKAYVISFSEAIANELKGGGITVTCLCPGPTHTGFQVRAGTERSALFRKFKPMDAKSVALDGYRGLAAGKTLVISGFRNWLLAESVRFAPRKMVTAVSGKLMQ